MNWKDVLVGLFNIVYNNKNIKGVNLLLSGEKEFPREKEEHKSECQNTTCIKVPKPKCFSKFGYLKTTEDFYGLLQPQNDNKIYFLIPCGLEWDESLKFWFITFPANGTDKDVIEFSTDVNSKET